ncbi:hypothetical protein Btru_022777 [Bulinus truncatus]|nr:hypothetical protein Btru_022777 [Bulinus truncatus]
MSSSVDHVIKATILCIVLLLLTISAAAPLSTSEYLKMRSMMIDENERTRIGSDLVLSLPELIVNDIFMKEKRAMIEESRMNRTIFVPTTSFYNSKAEIDRTFLFQLIHRMPKGAALHIHDQSMVSLDWIIKNVTYRDNVYMCLKQPSYLIFQVFNKTQSSQAGGDCDWKLITKEREMSTNVQQFDLNLRNNLSLLSADPFIAFPDNQAAWVRFGRFFRQVGQLLYYIPIFRDMLWQTMKEFREANVLYVEVRVNYVWARSPDRRQARAPTGGRIGAPDRKQARALTGGRFAIQTLEWDIEV